VDFSFMSWSISPHNEEDNIPAVESFEEGGTYVLGGSSEADLNVTYNYGKYFLFKSLHGKKAGETISDLEEAVKRLGTEQDSDHWEPTAGNVGHT
jgi:hypothetical protein